MLATLKTLVLKTATVTGVKLAAPADRIGLGFGVAAYPTDNLSSGQFSMPRNPEPEHVGSRQELSGMQALTRLHTGGDAVPLAGSAGCPSAPGLSASRLAPTSPSPFPGWQLTVRAAVMGRTHADPSRADLRGDLRHDNRSGRDCQSPRRVSDKRTIATREAGSAAAAPK